MWARREVVRQLEKEDGVDLPFGVYLLASALVAIAAVSALWWPQKHWLTCERFCPLPAPRGGCCLQPTSQDWTGRLTPARRAGGLCV